MYCFGLADFYVSKGIYSRVIEKNLRTYCLGKGCFINSVDNYGLSCSIDYLTPEKELVQEDLGLLQYHIYGGEGVVFQEEHSRLRTQKL